MKILKIPIGLCRKCRIRPTDQNPIERIAMCIGLCRVCAIKELLSFAKKQADKIPALELELIKNL